MSPLTIALIVLALIALQGFSLYFVLRRREEVKKDDTGMVLLQQQMQDLKKTLDSRLGDNSTAMSDFMNNQATQGRDLMTKITKQVSDQLLEVVKGVTETKESTKQVFVIAEQLSNLEKVLKNQKQRGNLGEASLELILANVLPPGQYQAQYQFKDGEKVDMVVKTQDGLIPIDAKFSLENYIRLTDATDERLIEQYKKDFKADVKKRIDETSKYIRPEEGTLPFAFMYIPAEGIYYNLLNSDVGAGINSRDLIEYAYKQKNVIIVSPTTFLAYLQTVLFGNQRYKIQETAKDIIKNVSELGKHLKSYEDSHNKLGDSLNRVVSNYESSGKAFKQIDKDVLRITGESIDLQLEVAERPLLPGREE